MANAPSYAICMIVSAVAFAAAFAIAPTYGPAGFPTGLFLGAVASAAAVSLSLAFSHVALRGSRILFVGVVALIILGVFALYSAIRPLAFTKYIWSEEGFGRTECYYNNGFGAEVIRFPFIVNCPYRNGGDFTYTPYHMKPDD